MTVKSTEGSEEQHKVHPHSFSMRHEQNTSQDIKKTLHMGKNLELCCSLLKRSSDIVAGQEVKC